MSPEEVARVAHEVNRAYCEALGDHSQVPWEEAPEWQRASALQGVALHESNPDAGPAASHESWMAQKEAGGWAYGPEKDPERKLHPCMVPFEDLPREQQAKDYLFRAVVHALMHPPAARWPSRMVRMTFTHPHCGDDWFEPMVAAAAGEFFNWFAPAVSALAAETMQQDVGSGLVMRLKASNGVLVEARGVVPPTPPQLAPAVDPRSSD